MTSLFTPFDLGVYHGSFLFSLLFCSIFINSFYFITVTNISLASLFEGLGSFFFSLNPNYFNKFTTLFIFSVLFILVITNFLSVFSFNFPLTSQISLVLFVGMSFWSSLIFFSLSCNLKGFVSHLIPEGTPLPLTVLLFLIELVSNIIRPLTLTVRLVANILAGHLLMSLLSSLIFSFPFCFPLYLGLNIVEIFVALIQSYIFCTIISLYFAEV